MKVLIDIPEEHYKRCTVMASTIRDGIVLDDLTNGEVIQKIFKVSDTSEGMATMFACTKDDDMLTADIGWWNRKWGE